MTTDPHALETETLIVARIFMDLLPGQGWHLSTLEKACDQSGFHRAYHVALFPLGLSDVYRTWHEACTYQAVATWPWERLEPLKVRERITALLRERLIIMNHHKHAVKIALNSIQRTPLFYTSLLWSTAHTLWCAAGDQSVDMNFYSKRVLLMWVDQGSTKDWFNQHPTSIDDLENSIQTRIQKVFQASHTMKTWAGRAKAISRPCVDAIINRFVQSRKDR